MSAVPFDTLKYAQALKTAGVSDAHAAALAEALRQGGRELASKADIAELRMSAKADIADLKAEIHLRGQRVVRSAGRGAPRAEARELEAKMRRDLHAIRVGRAPERTIEQALASGSRAMRARSARTASSSRTPTRSGPTSTGSASRGRQM